MYILMREIEVVINDVGLSDFEIELEEDENN